jgi:hypothetical protein
MLAEEWTDNLTTTEPDPAWIWRGLIAPRQITLMTGLWKAGKTTLLSHLLFRRNCAGTLLGQPVRPGVTAVVSEEMRAQWRSRAEKLPPGPNVCFFFRPFFGRPTRAQFDDLITQLLQLQERRALDLAVFDPLACFLPARVENSAEHVIAALAPLRRLTDAGIAVLLPHHPAKGNPSPGQAARGSGALSAFADILLELRLGNAGDPTDRRRILFGYSRSPATPPVLRFELNADGSDYNLLTEKPSGDFPRYWPVLFGVLEEAPDKLTRLQILDSWPADFPRPSLVTLWRWLDTACERALIRCEGTGRSADPFRYWLTAREQEWLKNPIYRLIHGLPPLEDHSAPAGAIDSSPPRERWDRESSRGVSVPEGRK